MTLNTISGAVVSLEQTFFRVSEDVGLVELCANIIFHVMIFLSIIQLKSDSQQLMELQVGYTAHH